MDFLDDSMKQMLLPGTEGMQPIVRAPRASKRERKESVADKLNSGQLPMFLTAKEIQENFNPLPGDYLKGETASDVWKRKAQESREGSPGDARKKTGKDTLADSIAKHGVQQPVSLYTQQPFVLGGHHRVAIAAETKPDMLIPVKMEKDAWNTSTGRKNDQRDGNPFRIGSGDRLNY